MNFETNKEKGNSGLGMAIAYFSTKGYTVSIPLNDTQDYDLVLEKDGHLKMVQVKLFLFFLYFPEKRFLAHIHLVEYL